MKINMWKYPGFAAVVEFAEVLKGYKMDKGTIRRPKNNYKKGNRLMRYTWIDEYLRWR